MKKENIALYVLRLAATLLIITTLVAAALAGVNHITAPIIAQAKEAKTQEAITNVLEGGGEPSTSPARTRQVWSPRFIRARTAMPFRCVPPASAAPSI